MMAWIVASGQPGSPLCRQEGIGRLGFASTPGFIDYILARGYTQARFPGSLLSRRSPSQERAKRLGDRRPQRIHFRAQCLLKYCTALSWSSAAFRVRNVPRFRRLPVLAFFLREYRRYPPDASFRITSGLLTDMFRCRNLVCWKHRYLFRLTDLFGNPGAVVQYRTHIGKEFLCTRYSCLQ